MSAPLRVAHVVGTAGATGVDSHLIALLSGFDRARVEPTLFVPSGGPLVDRLAARGIRVEMGAPTRKLAFAEARWLARRWRGEFDVVHAHGARVAFWSVRAARSAGVPAVVATVHELRRHTLPPGPKRALWVALEERSLDAYDRLVAVSRSERDELVARRPRWADRIDVVPGSTPLLLDPSRLPRRAARADSAPELRLRAVGRLEWVKGMERLVDAFALVARERPATLEILGSGSLAGSLRERAESLGVAGRISWRASVESYPDWLAGGDLFVTTTRSETHGLAVLEAMAVGLPVVATAVGGLPELLGEGEAGVLVARDPEATVAARCAEAIASLAADPARLDRLAENARARAAGQFAPARLAARVADLYEAAVSAARTRAR